MSTVFLVQTVVHHVNPPKVKVFPQQDFYSDENDCNLEKNSFPVASLFLEGILTLTRKTKIHSSVISSSSLICYARHFSAPVLFLS